MKQNKLETISNLFEGKEIRSVWNSEEEEHYFSVVDVIGVLTDNEYDKSRNYWKVTKSRLGKEGSELVTKCNRLKIRAKDGKYRETDKLDTEGILRLIELVPSKKAEPFKLWLASLGKERIDEVFDPEWAVNRAINYYKAKGYTLEWIKKRLISIADRTKLTDIWKEGGISKPVEFAILTNEIYKEWFGMKASECKEYKGIRKESLRDNMTDIELALTNVGEIAARDIAKLEHPKGLNENMSVAKRGGKVAKGARNGYEEEIKGLAISKDNALNYKCVDNKLLEDKGGKNE